MKMGRYAFFALSMAVLAGLALPASAQNYKGKFTLPVETHWGAAVLQPGEYTISTDSVGPTAVIVITGENSTASVFTGPVTFGAPTNGRGQIELTEVNGTHVVTRFYAAATGKDYSFSIPKSVLKNGFGAVAMKKAAVPVTSAQ
jgi:hypothetical protein